MKKVALLVPGVGAAVAAAIIGAAQASADAPYVIGEPYARAVAILQSQGYTAVFGGSVGSDLPQSQCIVIDQKGQVGNSWSTPWNPMGGGGTMKLRLDCNLHPGQQKPAAPGTRSMVPPGGSAGGAGGGARPTPGAGTVTVTPSFASPGSCR